MHFPNVIIDCIIIINNVLHISLLNWKTRCNLKLDSTTTTTTTKSYTNHYQTKVTFHLFANDPMLDYLV